MTEQLGIQILKCRDDQKPVHFQRQASTSGQDPVFTLQADSDCSWAKSEEKFGPSKLRPRIEPWLTALCQTEHLSLIAGSGLTHAVLGLAKSTATVGKPAGAETEKKSGISAMDQVDFGRFGRRIDAEVKRSAIATDRREGNIEDQIRVANELLRGLQILSRNAAATNLREILDSALKMFAASILGGERTLISSPENDRERAFNYLVSFLMSFAARSGTRDRLHIFTTNYDRLIEAGADVAGLHLLDRFVGALSPVFRSSRLDLDLHYNPPGIRGEPRYLEGVARFTKLHGSVDWIDCEGSIRRLGVPFGAKNIVPYLEVSPTVPADATQLIIYPNAGKDRETAAYPYVELFRDLAAAVCRPNTTLITYGYSFGDEHINRVIKDMLTIPSTHLVVISYDDRLGRIMHAYEEVGRPAQLSLLIGDHLGSLSDLVDHYLPKPAIDRTTFRMAELLKSRWATRQAEQSPQPGASPPDFSDEGDV